LGFSFARGGEGCVLCCLPGAGWGGVGGGGGVGA